jgi:tight adherence protein C
MSVLILIAGLVACAGAVTLLTRGLSASRLRTSETIGQIHQYGYTMPAEPLPAPSRGPLTSLLNRAVEFFGELLSERGAASNVRTELLAAAMYDTSVARFMGFRALLALGCGALWVWTASTLGYSLLVFVAGAAGAALAGWVFPLAVVRRRAQDRYERIEREMPDLMDLLVVTVESGMSFNASLKVATERLEGPLGDELRLTLQEQSLGLSIEEALRNMLARCNTIGIRSFVRGVLQGETMGVSIGQIMRNLAHEVRAQRKAAAEERAQKAPVKMLFPLIFLIFPAMFVVLLAPAVMDFVKAFHNVHH